MSAGENGRLVCSICQSNSHLRKVSSVVSDGSISSQYGRSAETDLAFRLRMPSRPSPRPEGDLAGKLVRWCLVLAAAWFLSTILINYLTIVIGGFVISAAILVVTMISRRNINRRKDKERVARETYVWNRMLTIWNDLYYCSRDDVAFSSRNPADYTSAAQMDDWLIRQSM